MVFLTKLSMWLKAAALALPATLALPAWSATVVIGESPRAAADFGLTADLVIGDINRATPLMLEPGNINVGRVNRGGIDPLFLPTGGGQLTIALLGDAVGNLAGTLVTAGTYVFLGGESLVLSSSTGNRGSWQAFVAPVPVPAAGGFLLFGFGGLALAARCKKGQQA